MQKIREPLNFFTHFLPFILAVPATYFLLIKSNLPIELAAAWVYGVNTILLFGISSIYHGYPSSEKGIRFWQKFDHCCIYLMIAGSYTPTSLLVFDGYIKWTLFGLVWLIAIVGCILKIFNRLQHNAISLTIYITMGCLIIPLINQMAEKLPYSAVIWMILGGAFYIGGTVFYFKDRPMGRYFHSHEIWAFVCYSRGCLSLLLQLRLFIFVILSSTLVRLIIHERIFNPYQLFAAFFR